MNYRTVPKIAATTSLDTLWQRWRLVDRQQKLYSNLDDQTISGKSALRNLLAALLINLGLSHSSTGLYCDSARVHSNTHSTSGTA